MFIPRSIKRKHPEILCNDQHTPKKLAVDSDQHSHSLSTHSNENNLIPDANIIDQIDVDPDTSFSPSETAQGGNSIKQFSSQQRLVEANQDEPVCIICGKYGEYINDSTENDVCSLECKSIDSDLCHTFHIPEINKQPNLTPSNIRIVQDYTAENLHAKWTNYQESDSVRTMTRRQRDAILKAHDIIVNGDRLPRPITSFDQCYSTLGDVLYNNLENELQWHMATSVQRMAVPIGLAGRDLIVTAPTHSGKTGAFLIPLLVHCQSLNVMHRYKRRGGPYALIVAPTRELCQQIEAIAQKLSRNLRNMRTALLIGGQPMSTQLHRLRKGVQIVIGTPGRILDIATHHPVMIRLWMMRVVVLDEADAIFGLGFEHQMKEIMAKLSNKAVIQTCLFSATTSKSLKRKLQGYLNDPVEISIRSSSDDDNGIPENMNANNDLDTMMTPLVRQTVLWVENKDKAKRLLSIIADPKYFLPPILVFVESRLGAEFLTRAIQKRNGALRVVAMHADKDQQERASIVAGVNNEQELAWDVVVTTDILTRGIDLPYVRLVINYDMTATLEDYIHRIGRAVIRGPLPRHSKQQRGWAITFINKEHEYLLPSFTKLLSDKALHQVTPLPSQLKRYL